MVGLLRYQLPDGTRWRSMDPVTLAAEPCSSSLAQLSDCLPNPSVHHLEASCDRLHYILVVFEIRLLLARPNAPSFHFPQTTSSIEHGLQRIAKTSASLANLCPRFSYLPSARPALQSTAASEARCTPRIAFCRENVVRKPACLCRPSVAIHVLFWRQVQLQYCRNPPSLAQD